MVNRLLMFIIVVGILAVGAQVVVGAESCYTFKQARVEFPGRHLYRSDGCWSSERRKRRRHDRDDEPRRKETRREEPSPVKESDQLYVIKPWQPSTRPLFLPWDDRVEPIIHPGAKP